jgi:hypothetical protein
MPLGAEPGDGRGDDLDLLAAERAALAGVRVQRGHRQSGALDAEVALQRLVGDHADLHDTVRAEPLRHAGEGLVHGRQDGAEAGGGEHHHRPAGPGVGAFPVSSARYSVCPGS